MRRMILLALGLLAATGSHAGQTVIYRCTSADGALSLQSMPCPAGSRTEVRRLDADYAPPLLALPSPVPAVTTPAPVDPEPAVPAPAVAVPAQRPVLPLPALHHCQPRSGAAYYTDRLEDSVRCLPMRVTGLDGNPDTGAGQACEVQRDRCESVPEANACRAWGDYLSQSRERYASAPSRSSSETDVTSAQIAALLAASRCALAPQNP